MLVRSAGAGLALFLALGTAGFEPAEPPCADFLSEAFHGLAYGDSVAVATGKLEDQCDELERIDVDPPYHPLARETQVHLVLRGAYGIGVDEVALTFGDDRLVQVEARGGARDGLWEALDEEPITLADYSARLGARMVIQPAEDAVWLLSPDALHPHLYLWANPDLASVDAPVVPYESSAARPDLLGFGKGFEELRASFQETGARQEREEIAAPWLPTEPEVQFQINLYGVPYAGFPRKIEAVFGDDRLQLAWILTGAGEEGRVRAALERAYGKAVFVSKTWEAFDGFRVALRKDKPEVLMIAEELVPVYRAQIESSAD